ncbi:uncharacterized protein LOC111259338 [Varroa jacobsoni]|uniref:uncharacterized protein LOC111259338 n=1 Tax=Varroa jacobsoni TaxID=62625 RepID=UPI000BF8379A|nr:uncharacterized protein LOC111259338 [Varroa jacobsoni]
MLQVSQLFFAAQDVSFVSTNRESLLRRVHLPVGPFCFKSSVIQNEKASEIERKRSKMCERVVKRTDKGSGGMQLQQYVYTCVQDTSSGVCIADGGEKTYRGVESENSSGSSQSNCPNPNLPWIFGVLKLPSRPLCTN